MSREQGFRVYSIKIVGKDFEVSVANGAAGWAEKRFGGFLPMKPSKVNKSDVSLKSTITTHIGSTSVPARSHSASFKAFIDLPNDDPHCTRVDVKNGSWFYCSLCDTNVKGRSDRPFTIGQWKEHIQSSAHTTRLKSVDYLAQLREKQEKGKVRIYMKHAFLSSSILKTGC